jgi:hypothetical protein
MSGAGFGVTSVAPAGQPMSAAPCGNECCDCCCDSERYWFRGEYMAWWTSGTHVPPLVSTVTDVMNPTGSLATVFGDRVIRDGQHDGYRINFGMWLDKCHCNGLEADYFDLQGREDNYDSGLTGGYTNGTLFPIVRAFIDPNQRTISVNAVGYPSQFFGRATVDTNDFFQSAGIWLRHNLRSGDWSTNGCDSCCRTFRVDAIAGYRFSRLIDYVNVADREIDINPVDATNFQTVFTNIDQFHAANTFNGTEIGLDTEICRGRWSLDLLGKVALGLNTQDIRLFGLVASDASETGGGINVAAATEELSINRFSWMPEFVATAGFQLNDHVKLTAAYDIIYWSQVARAGNQIAFDTRTGLPFGPQPALTPAAVKEGDFWAEGFRLGGEISF